MEFAHRFLRIALPLLVALWFPSALHAALTWDATHASYNVQRGETNASFTFTFANPSTNAVVVRAVHASCQCTTARMPFPVPGSIAPESTGRMEVNVDLRDRNQPFKQIVAIETSAGTNQITLDIHTPELTAREESRLVAFADRQAVFKGQCADCHFRPAAGKPLSEQVKVLCGTCHDSPDRAEMVPDLALKAAGKDRAYWDQWIRRGKPGTFMPAFGKPWGGPFNDDDLRAMEDYLVSRYR